MTEVMRNGNRVLRSPEGTLVEVKPDAAQHLLTTGMGGRRFTEVTEADVTRKDIEAQNSTVGARFETAARGAGEAVGDLGQLASRVAGSTAGKVLLGANPVTALPYWAMQGTQAGAKQATGLDANDTSRSLAAQTAGVLSGDREAEQNYAERTALLKQINPGSYTAGEVVGQVGAGMLTGGVTSAAGRGITAGLTRAGVGQAAARMAGTGAAMAVEGGAYGAAATEGQARESGQTDGATAEQLWQGIGLGALLSGSIGAAGSGASSLFKRIASAEQKAVAPIAAQEAKAARAAMTGTADDSIARLSSQVSGAEYETLAKYGPHVNTPEAKAARELWKNRDAIVESKVSPMTKDLQAVRDSFDSVTEIVRNPVLRKELAESIPEAMRPQAAEAGATAIRKTIDNARNIMGALPQDAYSKEARAALKKFVDFGESHYERAVSSGSAADINAAANTIKQNAQQTVQTLGAFVKADRSAGLSREVSSNAMKSFEQHAQEPLRQSLESEVWGVAGQAQKEVNSAWVNALGKEGKLARFNDAFFGKGAEGNGAERAYRFADTAKVKSWLETAGTVAGETKQTIVREAVDAIDSLASTIGKYHEMTPGQAKQLATLQESSSRIRKALADVDETVGVANEIEQGIIGADKKGLGQLISPGAMAATGAVLAGPLGALAGAGIGMLARPGAAMTARQVIESVAGRFGVETKRGVTQWIGDVIQSGKRAAEKGATVTGKAARPIVPAAVSQFIGRDKDLRAAYESKLDGLIQAQRDPNKLIDSLVGATGNLAEVDPRLASAMFGKAQTAIQFLASKAPGGTLDPTALQPNRKAVVSDLDMKRFARVYMAVEKPATVLADLRRGTATPDQIEALRVVHPETYEAIRATVIDALAGADRKGTRLPLAVRSQLDLLLDLGGAGVPALGPEIATRISGLQAAKQQQRQGRRQKKSPNLVASVKLPQQSWPSLGV